MNFIYLLLSVFGESGGYVFDRMNFKRTRIGVHPLMFLSFMGMIFFLSLFIVFNRIPLPEFKMEWLIIVSLIILVSFIGNLFDALSLKADDLAIREPLIDFYPILAGLVGYIAFAEERKPIYLQSFIAGTFVVWWGLHRVKLGKVQKKGLLYLMIAVLFTSFMPLLYKYAVEYLTPEYITLFRVSGIVILLTVLFPFNLKNNLKPDKIKYSLLSGFACSVGMVASIYAISAYGVVVTMLFFMLGPAIRYLSGFFILKEKIRRGEVIASLMLSVIVAISAFAA